MKNKKDRLTSGTTDDKGARALQKVRTDL